MIRGRNRENIFKYESSFSGRDAKRDMESNNKTKSVKRMTDIKDSKLG